MRAVRAAMAPLQWRNTPLRSRPLAAAAALPWARAAAAAVARCSSDAASAAPKPASLVDTHAAKRGDLPRREVTMDDVTMRYARSGGPGGQHANKVNTKVDMRFNVFAADFLPDWVKEELLESQAGRINSEGTLSVTSERSRSQARNRDDALAKLTAIVAQASHLPPPPSAEVQRRVRSRIKRGNERRIQGKKRQQNKKAQRKEWR